MYRYILHPNYSEYTREVPEENRRRRSVLNDDNDPMTIPNNLVCAGYPHGDEAEDHDGDHEKTLAANDGFEPDQGGPIICKEPLDANDETKGWDLRTGSNRLILKDQKFAPVYPLPKAQFSYLSVFHIQICYHKKSENQVFSQEYTTKKIGLIKS